MLKSLFVINLLFFTTFSIAGPHWVAGKVTSLSGHGSEPAIRLTGNVKPDNCDGGNYNWLLFEGSAQEKQWIYSTALAMALTGKHLTAYTNNDGNRCRIHNIQVTEGLD